eukprot:Em0008g569a
MDEFHIAVRDRYSSLSDAELDEEVIRIKQEYPNTGIKITIGLLQSHGYRVQRARVHHSLMRVDPAGLALRQAQSICRRVYHVQGPLSLWHIDGNHKLIR